MRKILLLMLIVTSLTSYGQRSSFFTDTFKKWNECKSVAITLTGGDVALKGRNYFSAYGAPKSMMYCLTELNNRDELIDDVVLTENGSWLVLWGNNGVSLYGCPLSLSNRIKEFNDKNEIIYSITFNDNGDWIIISKDKYSASSQKIMDFLAKGEQTHGELWAAHLTNTGLAVVYSKGYEFLGDVPYNLKNKLRETSLDVFRLKFLPDGAYFFADINGKFECYL